MYKQIKRKKERKLSRSDYAAMISYLHISLLLRMTNKNSLLKVFLQLVTLRSELLKIHEFL
jgi:hypothetical protein